jgi:hypothetical protein
LKKAEKRDLRPKQRGKGSGFRGKKIEAGHPVRPHLTHKTLENCSTPLPIAYTNPGFRHVTSVGDKGPKKLK